MSTNLKFIDNFSSECMIFIIFCKKAVYSPTVNIIVRGQSAQF